MVTARDRLARTLRADAQTAFSVELTAKMADLSLQVAGFGPVRFPVTPAKARKLAGLGQPARFGRGEKTVTDPDVRDTWEIPKHLVRAEWDDAALNDILATVKEELGLPNAAGLTADLHSLLVYEPNQFFLVHQDSEKDDSMVGTLVVTLPSSYAAATLAPFWDAAVRGRTPGEGGRTFGLFGRALHAAGAVADRETAALLLRPFRIENLTGTQVKAFTKLADGQGQQWTAELLRTWFGGDQPASTYGGGQERPRWVAGSLPALCEGLHAAGRTGALAAQRLVDLAWEWLGKDIGAGMASSLPSRRDEKLGALGKPLASVLTAAAAIGAVGARDIVAGYIREQGDAVTALEMSALRAAAEPSGDGTCGDAGFGDLAADCAARLRARLARPLRASGDWSIELRAGGCTCDLCDTLRAFLQDKGRRTFEWPIAKQRRQHIHSRIDAAELPVTHVTRRQGSPYTLVLAKTDALFAREQEARTRDETDLGWLASRRNPGA
jgi:hypothetical protein